MAYTTKENVLEYITIMGVTGVTASTIPDTFLDAADAEIDAKTHATWEVATETLIQDGNGQDWVCADIIPIVSITGLYVRDSENENEVEITVSGSEDEVEIMPNYKTGFIYLKPDVDLGWSMFARMTEDGVYDGSSFPKGVQNITITGTFGQTNGLIEEIATLLVLKRMSMANPLTYGLTKTSEKLSKYSYSLGNSNRIQSLDQRIDELFSLLPKENDIGVFGV